MSANELGLPTFPGPSELARDLRMQAKWQKGNVAKPKRGRKTRSEAVSRSYTKSPSHEFFFILRSVKLNNRAKWRNF